MATNRKRTKVADLIAAAKVGAIDPSTEVLTAEDAEALRAEGAASVQTVIVTAERTGTEHECAIPGCRHGAAHGPKQPDRQIKLQCAVCGAVARVTSSALAKAGQISDQHGPLAVAARRTYVRRAS